MAASVAPNNLCQDIAEKVWPLENTKKSVQGAKMGTELFSPGSTPVAHSNVRSGELTYKTLINMPAESGGPVFPAEPFQ